MSIRKRIMEKRHPSTARRLTQAALHGKKATTRRAMSWADGRFGRQRRSSHTGLIGLGAAALAIPVGLLVGRRLYRDQDLPIDQPL